MIDEREIKCCCKNPNCRKSGISFCTTENNKPLMRFHFLETEKIGEKEFTHFKTRSMHLNKHNIKQLINSLSELL
jgi:hypothetical protein